MTEGERKNMKQDTLEGRAKTKNGVKRLCFSAVCILLEAAFIIAMITKLNQYAEIINLITRLLAGVLVLKLYASDQTSSMKMPWVILILVFPILGVGLYLLIGLNGGTRKMWERYDQIDRELLPLLPNDSECRETLGRKIPKAGNISDYIQKNASYPVYQNTDVIYYDEAVKGLEAQLADLAKAEKFIFMEYHAIEDAQAWHKIQRVLEDRVKAGVEVRVFYDDMGSIGFINTDFIKKMENVGIHCRVFNPFTPGLNVFLNNRDHRKITVIDGKVGFTGGYNLANEYFNFTHPYGQWKDTGIRLEGEAVRSLTVTFLEMWNAVSDKDKNDSDFTGFLVQTDYQAKQTGFIQPYADSPMDHEQVGEEDMTDNMMLRSYRNGKSPFLDRKGPKALALKIKEQLEVMTPSISAPVRQMSGGNVQKVLVGREIAQNPKVLLVAFPTRGVDVNTSHVIYRLLNEQKKKGVAVVCVIEDLDVVLELCDRIAVFCGGKISGIEDGRTATKEGIGILMTKHEKGGTQA